MSKFEILCVTMHQKDFSKLKEMNIHSDVVYANQADRTSYDEMKFEGHTAKMVTTATRGVGVNRNLALTYASAEICLLADDDVVYKDNVEELVTAEFNAHPDADVFIFHLDTDDPIRQQISYPKTKKCSRFCRMPWGGVRIAVRLNSVRKANIWFTTLFGGGCIFPSGEDSMWLRDAMRKGLCFYVSKETIGRVSFETSTWFTGYNENFFYGKGAYCVNCYKRLFYVWMIYYAFRYRKKGELSFKEKCLWMKKGRDGYHKMLSYENYIALNGKH